MKPWCECGHEKEAHGVSIINDDYALVCYCGICELGAEFYVSGTPEGGSDAR